MNKVILMGRLTRDPEVRYSQGERSMAIARYTLAVDRRGRRSQDGDQGQTADFINIVTWNKTAELCGNSLLKGQRALVEGRLQIRSYDDKDGNRHWVTEVIADRVEFIERKGSGSPAPSSQGSTPSQSGNAQNQGGMESFGSPMGFDEEIPF